MTKHISLLIFAIIASFNLSCFTASQHAQDNKIIEVDASKSKFISKTIKLEGWNIPLPAEKELVSSSESKQEENTVTEKTYKFQKAPEMRLDIFSTNADNSLNMGFEIVQMKQITSYATKGKIFGYLTGGIVIQSDDNGTIGCGCIVSKIYFSDEDGDGKFESMKIGTDVKAEVPKPLKSKNNKD